MTRKELIRKITTFPIIASILAEDLLAGDFRSVFRGQGIEADEVRRYEIGDDIRAINWSVSARFGMPYVKMYREEKEMSVYLVLDCSASMDCGTVMKRSEQAALAAALLAFSAERSGQRLGSVCFDSSIKKMFPAGKGRSHTLAVIRSILQSLSLEPDDDAKSVSFSLPFFLKSEKTMTSDVGEALTALERLLKRRSLVFVISDFYCMRWEQELGRLCRRHDVVAVRVSDPLDAELYNAGLVSMEDPETGAKISAATGFSSFRAAWQTWHAERAASWKAIVRRVGASPMELSTSDDTAAALIRFFKGRRR